MVSNLEKQLNKIVNKYQLQVYRFGDIFHEYHIHDQTQKYDARNRLIRIMLYDPDKPKFQIDGVVVFNCELVPYKRSSLNWTEMLDDVNRLCNDYEKYFKEINKGKSEETQKCVDAYSKEELEEIKEIIGKYSIQEKQTENSVLDAIRAGVFHVKTESCRCQTFHNIANNKGELYEKINNTRK